MMLRAGDAARSSSAAISAIASIERADAVGEAGADRELAAIDGGVGAAHRLGGQAAVGGNQAAEFGVEPIDVGLDRGAGALRRAAHGHCRRPCCSPANTKLHDSPALASAPLSSTCTATTPIDPTSPVRVT